MSLNVFVDRVLGSSEHHLKPLSIFAILPNSTSLEPAAYRLLFGTSLALIQRSLQEKQAKIRR